MHILPPRSWEVIRFEIIYISQMSVSDYLPGNFGHINKAKRH